MQGDEQNGVELTGCAALCRRLLRELLEHLRVLGVGRQVQQPCRVVAATKQKHMSVAGCSIASEEKTYGVVRSMSQCV